MAPSNSTNTLFFVKSKDADLYLTIEDISKLGGDSISPKLGNIGRAYPMNDEQARFFISILGDSNFVAYLPDQDVARSLLDSEHDADRLLLCGLIDHKYDLVTKKHSALHKTLRDCSILMGAGHLSDLDLFHAAMDCSVDYIKKGGYVSDQISDLAVKLRTKQQSDNMSYDADFLDDMLCDQYEIGCLILIHEAQG